MADTRPSVPSLVRSWFGLTTPVRRGTYAATGVGLMVLKYAVDTGLVSLFAGRVWTPWSYLNPSLTVREFLLRDSPPWLLWVLGAWTLPFLWVGVSMTIRRAANAGLPASSGLLFFVPVVNYVWMLILCVAPEGAQTIPSRNDRPIGATIDRPAMRILRSNAAGTVSGLSMLGVSVFVLGDYGTALFVGTPFVMGFLSGFVHNVPTPRPMRETMYAIQTMFLVTGGILLLFALEGLLCLLMAYPLAAVIGALGGIAGRGTAVHSQLSIAHGAAIGLTPLALLGIDVGPSVREVVTTVEIAAPPSAIWPHVVGFAEMPPPSNLIFRLGIAYPVRATLVGNGLGAVRRCVFSTGAFVEPITDWHEGVRLGFDVTHQPPPLQEWSPYRSVTPRHLTQSLQVHRGEFRLIPAGQDLTRLEGSTWYEQRLFPGWYWNLFSDALIHAIHARVLRHIRRAAEAVPLRS